MSSSCSSSTRSPVDLERYVGGPRWYQRRQEEITQRREHGAPDTPLPTSVAYFSMEFGVHEALPNYSGGLGILAGDHLKAASDLGVPLIAVGLLYRSGYFRQSLSLDGWQIEHYPVLDPRGLPLELLTEPSGAADAGARGHAGRPDAARQDLEGAGRAHPVAAARLRRGAERRGPARRHRPALRRRPEPPDPPGDPRRHRRGQGGQDLLRAHRARAARGVPHQRGPRRVPRPRADPRATSPTTASTSTRRSRPCAPVRCSRRTRPCPPASTGSRSTWCSTTSAPRTCCPA